MEKMKLDRALRDAAKLTQDGLAEKLGVDRSTVAKWETGDALPRAGMLPKIASIFGCSIDDLFCPASEETAQAQA
jgi:transcriptional regulator with XRE-family HTH domain